MLSYLSPSWRQCLAASYRSQARRCPRGFLSRFHAEEAVVEHELYDLFGLVGGYTRTTEDTFQLPRIEFLPLTNKVVNEVRLSTEDVRQLLIRFRDQINRVRAKAFLQIHFFDACALQTNCESTTIGQ